MTQLGLRADTGPLADQRARQGVAAIIDREAIRAAVAPEALPADAFGLAPSEPGLRRHRAGRRAGPARPGAGRPAAGRRRLGAQPDHRPVDGRRGAGPAGRSARRPSGPTDVRVAQQVAEQLDAAGIDTYVVAPTGVELFGLATVPPSPPAAPRRAPGRPTRHAGAAPRRAGRRAGGPRSPPAAATTTVTPTTWSATTAAAPAAGGVAARPDGAAAHRRAATRAPSWPPTTAARRRPRWSRCRPGRRPGSARRACSRCSTSWSRPTRAPDAVAAVERALWNQVPALPLFQPVTLVVSTPRLGRADRDRAGAAGHRPGDRGRTVAAATRLITLWSRPGPGHGRAILRFPAVVRY